MPPSAKTSTSTKKPGAPKTKGAARAKSGCYTCRIRRKKCDEQKSEHGSCRTCDRLRLECLGYGIKRPDWLRETQTVVDIRERIKKFLAAQGMIKGHSGPASRDADQDSTFLVLRPDCHSSPETESSTMSGYQRSVSPELLSSVNPGEWDSCPQFSLPSNHGHEGSLFLQQVSRPPIDLVNEEIDYAFVEIQGLPVQIPNLRLAYPATYSPIIDPIANYYSTYVFESQYLLADKSLIKDLVIASLQYHPVSKEIVHILAELHFNKRRLPHRTEQIPPILHYLKRTGCGTIDDAMAVLHSVSVYLFNGGDGAWDECIDFAARHVLVMLDTTLFCVTNPLQICDAKTAFVIKTAIWFDVLASITSQKAPRLRAVIDRLFNPSHARIQDLGDPTSDQCSMLSPMGCENDVVWALSEISSLAEWKSEQQSKGILSIPELVARSKVIEQCLDNFVYNQPCREDKNTTSQYSASNIFRAAAHLYLATVVSGDFPLVTDVVDKVRKTYFAILAIPRGILQPVVRSTVFAFFLCGCFSTEPSQQDCIKSLLMIQEESTEIGNCKSIVTLLESIWSEAATSDPEHSHSISWRGSLKSKHILLV
ncbi:hypothetical protein AX15_002004 [Amanita polypyramis BW_CC]|nr:hypothetical protein AX15_002004 [Amanita polypyramis BW_CC]